MNNKDKIPVFQWNFTNFVICCYKILLWQPNFVQELPIWPGCNALPKTRDLEGNKKTYLAFFKSWAENSKFWGLGHGICIDNVISYMLWFSQGILHAILWFCCRQQVHKYFESYIVHIHGQKLLQHSAIS